MKKELNRFQELRLKHYIDDWCEFMAGNLRITVKHFKKMYSDLVSSRKELVRKEMLKYVNKV